MNKQIDHKRKAREANEQTRRHQPSSSQAWSRLHFGTWQTVAKINPPPLGAWDSGSPPTVACGSVSKGVDQLQILAQSSCATVAEDNQYGTAELCSRATYVKQRASHDTLHPPLFLPVSGHHSVSTSQSREDDLLQWQLATRKRLPSKWSISATSTSPLLVFELLPDVDVLQSAPSLQRTTT